MGIRGLTGWIKWTAGSTLKEPNWSDWKGKKIGVDILGFLYKAKALHYNPLVYLGKMIAAFKKYDIIPVPVFDGKPPEEKRETLKQRSELRARSDVRKTELEKDMASMSTTDRSVAELELRALEQNTTFLTSEERTLAKQLLYACGVTVLNASGEADNVLAYFAKREELVAIVSNDMDLLTRGVQILLVPENYALPGDTSGWTQYTLNAILESSSLTYQQFVEMCVLMGCDYTAGLKSFPYKAAYWNIKYHKLNIEDILAKHNIVDVNPYKKAIIMLTGVDETMDSLMGSKQWDKWAEPTHAVEVSSLAEFRKASLAELSEDEYSLLSNGLI